jgi:hypothetical protein
MGIDIHMPTISVLGRFSTAVYFWAVIREVKARF